ncbi:APC family permease [Brevibacterium linens]|uniref:Amino acid/polyamine/organocation transporter, APC superfamily (TC 2.A.3) n=1 Tax=Brevibacterium linens ATCC 9172 TaxID=1255617 RepID=A0A2H1IN22_BRELN|nr:APC family permease [Brevibacterium linens]KAB1946793.1 APC family permease [Brevibacterium linens ATCC 9172]SMX76556.1 amino acid/polyamine/organocation transporter, APC superfamily (TC 2.A.3) [Brevibacterium linens ATCC 9172]
MFSLTTKAQRSQDTTLAAGKLGTWDIVFFVISAAAPLTVIVSGAITSFRMGGIGAPGAIVFCAMILIFFALGFTAMSKSVKNAGAFYAYVSRGLGKPWGIGVSSVTVFAYVSLVISFYGFIGFFAQFTAVELFGLDLPWGVWSLLAVATVAFLGYRKIDVGAKVLAVLLTCEVAILLILAVCTLADGGPEPWSLASFDPANVFFAPAAGTLFVMGFGAYLGFESTAIYAEEAKDSEKTVPRATIVAVAFLGIFYGFTFWVLTVTFGVEGVVELARSDSFETMVITGTGEVAGAWAAFVMKILIVTSFFACVLSFHNACTRYLFALGREGLLPRGLGRSSLKHGAPAVASLTLSGFSAVGVIIAIVIGADPFLGLALWTYATGVQGLVFAQAVTSVAVVWYFLRDRRGHSCLRVTIAPILGALGLIIGYLLIATNFEVVTGLNGPINKILLVPTPVLFISGIVTALIIRAKSPRYYESLNQPRPGLGGRE